MGPSSLSLMLVVVVTVHTIECQTVCSSQTPLEWRPKQHVVSMNWTLLRNICGGPSECWGAPRRAPESAGPSLGFPQICPLGLQSGDKLAMSADGSLKSYGIRLLNVSEANFESCSVPADPADHFLSPRTMNESERVETKWLNPGHHYFIALHDGDPQMCKLGLRLHVSVRVQLCQASPLLRLCSGNGVCQADPEDSAYTCRCYHGYSGMFCEKSDPCLENPCQNKGVCLSNGSADQNHRTYKCLCPPHFTGVDCSEIIGRENCVRICTSGRCVQVSPVSFRCLCRSGDPPCETWKDPCDPNPCRNGGICSQGPAGFLCHCPDGFAGVRCHIDCTQPACVEERNCTAGRHAPECVCADVNMVPDCRRQKESVCSPSPCLNNATCVSKGNEAVCRCLRGFSGKNCEEIIDYCRLLNINCLNEGLCLSVIGGYQCVCSPGWTGEFCQYVGDACLVQPNRCANGATCVTTSQPTSPPRHTCKCSLGFTGEYCEAEINECASFPCQHNGTCVDLLGRYACRCPAGFVGQNCEIDVDSCALANTSCPPGTRCLDLPGSLEYTCRVPCPQSLQPCDNGGRCVLNNASGYTCVCAPGWSGPTCRLDVNDCVQHWCRNGATCVDEIDGYSCVCPPGLAGVYCERDVDDCVDHRCSEHSVCLDRQNGYTCLCLPGFEGPLCQLETNECDSVPCAHGATCVDLISDYRCQCLPGFEGRTCSENVNDCWLQPCLNGGSCVDLINDYICHCPLGFGGAFCDVDLDECHSKPCQNGGVCADGLGMYECFCADGYVGSDCEINYDECLHGYCANNSTCIDLVADYECVCPPGFAGKNCSLPVNACAPDVNFCKNGGTCFHSGAGEMRCVCPPGYRGADCSSPLNLCKSNPCKPEGTLHCEELANTYRCVCQHGHTGPRCQTPIKHCVDGLCQHGSTCEDLSGGFTCHCSAGLKGQFCEINIDECEEKPCGILSLCEDALNGYTCFCAPGFIGKNCETEVNECLSRPCGNGGSCVDELNSFSCQCPPGVTGDHCEVDVDECASSPCLHNATCIDSVHGYNCVCATGFTGSACELDIDECASSPCRNGATCVDQSGNYFCQCAAPFKGPNCEFLPCEANNPCENGAVCVEELDRDHFPLGFRCHCRRGFTGPRCEINVDECSSSPCFHGFCYDVVDGFYCLCSPGYTGPTCEQELDDCVNSSCSANSVCRDLHLSYECVCHPGWEGEFCQQETDECLSHPCKHDATCADLLDGYKCFCSPGWTGVDCAEDVNECDSAPCLNGAGCQESDVPGEFSCTCPPFFSGPFCSLPHDPCGPVHNPCLNNSTCLTRSDGTASCRCPAGFEGSRCESDADECASDPCQNGGACADRVNGYSCDCKMGFSGPRCEEDIDECAPSPCHNAAVCQDLVNRFRCVCPQGYFGTLCDLDVNECEDSPCLHESICINKRGSFECICRPGYSGPRCDVDIDECASAPCQNSGGCIDGTDGFLCLCPAGFAGLRCETNVDECVSAPCLHGSCEDGIYSYSCLCQAGWTGSRCETNIDDCAASPCLSGGTCVDLIDKFACFCKDGYTGKTCQDDIDVCSAAASSVSLCFNGATCVDGEGSTFTCSCPAGFVGEFCEVDVNECCSAPCHNGAICQDLINSYVCHCRSGWTGSHCEDDINECLPQPCNQGICIQSDPGYGYTCFCRPGFVGSNCEHNYDDCLLNPCPEGFSCIDGINDVSCLPPVLLETTVRSISHGLATRDPLSGAELSADSSYVRYFGNSFLEFGGVELAVVNNITVSFQTAAAQGTLLYVDQGPANPHFFMKLFVLDGLLQYAFCCNEEEGVTRIGTSVPVDDDRVNVVNIRQHLTPCEAELALGGHGKIKSNTSNYWVGHMMERTNHIFTGGLPHPYLPNQRAEPFHNYTGCIQIIEINNRRNFHTWDAISGTNIGQCRHAAVDLATNTLDPTTQSPTVDTTHTAKIADPVQTPKHPAGALEVCGERVCGNGGTCQRLPGEGLPSCHCPLHFTGAFCEKDAMVYIPSFDGTSYLELRPLPYFLRSPGSDGDLQAAVQNATVTLSVSVKTRETQGTILYTEEQTTGDRFLHVFIEDGSPVARLGCGGGLVLNAAAEQNIHNGRWMNITVRYNLPVGKRGGSCAIELAVDDGTARRLQEYVSHPASAGTFGPVFLGAVSSGWESPDGAGEGWKSFVGCMGNLRVDSSDGDLMGEAVRGRNIQNCDPPVCQHLPCRNGGTCVSDAGNWFCQCRPLYTGRLCQFSACERNPCSHGATCMPKSPLEAVCLCPYGRQGLLCEEPINITRARFSGGGQLGYTSFAAHSSLPSFTFFYEFRLQFTLANNSTAARDNLVLFAGHKGQGNDGDDYLVLGLRGGRAVHRFNLGSGVATIVGDRLDPRVSIHSVAFGRSGKTGWLKVDGQPNRTRSSPGPLRGLKDFKHLFVGGYREYTPELLPLGSRFSQGFQGCIFDVKFSTRRGGTLRALGRPSFGRNVGQCGVNPCDHVRCGHGGTCVDSGSSVYCQCPLGWKGALCSETVSVCDVEHSPPPLCARGSTCIPLPTGYTCRCPLGTAGMYCDKAVTLSDPFFSGSQSSWMSFQPVRMRHTTVLQLQFQPLSPHGLLLYVAQHLSASAGDFICLSLTSGFVQLRFNLGDGVRTLRSTDRVDTLGTRWHTVEAGRVGHRGFLRLDGKEVKEGESDGMSTLDVATEIFVGGVSTLSLVSVDATDGEPVGFTGGIREVTVNGEELELTEGGAVGGANVGDWDGTACGYKVCQNGGRCTPVGTDAFTCTCPPVWTGSVCNQSVACVNNVCRQGSSCVPSNATSYRCVCPLGWGSRYCDSEIPTDTLRFVGNSYVKYSDPRYSRRNLRFTQVSFSFLARSRHGLITWVGKAQQEDDDYLAVGLENGRLKIAVNLGEKLPPPVTLPNVTFCCGKWHNVTVSLSSTVLQVFHGSERILLQNLDPFERYVALNYGGRIYFAGFELHRKIAVVTSGLFSQAFEGKLKNVYLFKDTKPLLFLKDTEGFNVFEDNEQ